MMMLVFRGVREIAGVHTFPTCERATLWQDPDTGDVEWSCPCGHRGSMVVVNDEVRGTASVTCSGCGRRYVEESP